MSDNSSKTIEIGDISVKPGEKCQFRHEVTTTYHGDPVEIPVTIINGLHDGPRIFLSAAVHGDELNGIKVVQEVAQRYDPMEIHGSIICIHVLNVPGFLKQQRYVPISDEDLNRSFPGKKHGTLANRLAYSIFTELISICDLGIDLHTSTRKRTAMYHVRADMRDPRVERVARAVGTSMILDSEGSDGTLRKVACKHDIPTVTIEMGRAHRFQSTHYGRAIRCIDNVLAEHEIQPAHSVMWPGWRRVVARGGEKRWIRAETGGLVQREWGLYPFVEVGEPLFSITDHFMNDIEIVSAPFTGLVVGVLESPVVYPGHPLCLFVRIRESTADIIREDIQKGEFDVYLEGGFQWSNPERHSEADRYHIDDSRDQPV